MGFPVGFDDESISEIVPLEHSMGRSNNKRLPHSFMVHGVWLDVIWSVAQNVHISFLSEGMSDKCLTRSAEKKVFYSKKQM